MTAESTFGPDGIARWTPSAPPIKDPRETLEAVGREILTPIGALFWAKERGVTHPFAQLVNTTPSEATLRRIEADYSAAAVRVPGVLVAKFRLLRGIAGIELAAIVTFGGGSGTLRGAPTGQVSAEVT